MTDIKTSVGARAKGNIAPIPTVFDGNGEPDLPMIERLADWYVSAGVHGFFVLGSQGQGPACRIDQRKAVAQAIVTRVDGRVPVIIQVGSIDPYSCAELAAHAKEIGADGIGVVGPYYYSDHNEWELIEYHRIIDAAADLPMLLYNNPQYSGYPCPPALMAKIREAVPNVFGAKLAKGDISQAGTYLRVLSRDFSVFVPINMMLPGMLVGVRGSIASGVPVTVPEIGVQLVEAMWNGNHDLAVKLQVLMLEYGERIAPLKQYGRRTTFEGLHIRGLDIKEYPRWPTKPMTAAHLKLFEESLTGLLDELHQLTAHAKAAE